MRILFATGGTGGHINAAINLAKGIAFNKDIELKFLLNSNPVFEDKLKKNNFDYNLFFLNRPSGYALFRWLLFVIDGLRAFIGSISFIRKFRPDVLIGFGSYAAVPVVLACYIMSKTTVIILHEQNVVPGKANRLLAFTARKIAVSFRRTESYFKDKAVLTGNFIDPAFYLSTKEQALKSLSFIKDKPTMLVMGGSQGAEFINNIFLKTVDLFKPDFRNNLQIIHICGEKNYDEMQVKYKNLQINNYKLYGFSGNMPTMLVASDLVLCRAGATSIAEINAAGKPAILIPYPFAGGHQKHNAHVLEEAGAAITCFQNGLEPDKLAGLLSDILCNKDKLETMAEASSALANPTSINSMKELIKSCYENVR